MEPIIGIGSVLELEDGEVTVVKITSQRYTDAHGNNLVLPVVHLSNRTIVDGRILEAWLQS